MVKCVLCQRPNPPKRFDGLCSTCYQEYRAWARLEEEPYRLLKRGDLKSLHLLGFLQFLKQGEINWYTRVWQLYACVRKLQRRNMLPDFDTRAAWISWAEEAIPAPCRQSRAIGEYLAYKGLDPERYDNRGWFEQLIAGKTPHQVEGVAEYLRDQLRQYLAGLRNRNGVKQGSTLDIHGRHLIPFFEWMGKLGLDSVEAVTPAHITSYLTTFKADGVAAGGKPIPGHVKTTSTMASLSSVLRSFFTWAQRNRLCSDNPVEPWTDRRERLTHPLPEAEIIRLTTVWTDLNTPPRDAMVGLMLLVYGLFPRQLLALNCDAFDLAKNQFRGLQVPVPIPPVLRPVLTRYFAWRTEKVPANEQSLIVSWKKGKFTRAKPPLLLRTLRPYGVTPRQLRVTALANTVQYGSLKLLAVFGLTTDGMEGYRDIARLAESIRKVTPKPNLW